MSARLLPVILWRLPALGRWLLMNAACQSRSVNSHCRQLCQHSHRLLWPESARERTYGHSP